MIIKINHPSDKQKVIDYIRKLPDKKFIAKIERAKEIRSMSQNKLYWMWLSCIQADTGNFREDLHEEFSRMFLPKVTRIYRDEEIEKPISTTKLDTKQFTDYLDRVQQFASVEFGCILPNPEDLIFNEFVEAYQNQI